MTMPATPSINSEPSRLGAADATICAVHVPEIRRAVQRSVASSRMTRSEREDLEQSTWVRLLERLRDVPEITSVAAFATGVAKNVVREHMRVQRRRDALEHRYASDLREVSAGPHPVPVDVAYEICESIARVKRAKASLGTSDRWLIEARFVEGASYAQILPVFGATFARPIRSEEGLRTALFHARDRLRIALDAAERRA